MEYRRLGRTGYQVSAIGFGAWAIGGGWGDVDDATGAGAPCMRRSTPASTSSTPPTSTATGAASASSRGSCASAPGERIYVATKMGRRVEQRSPTTRPRPSPPGSSRSRENLGVERIDLVQLHCPPTDVYYRPELFAALDELVAEGVIAHYGVSVEKVEEALKAIEYPGVATVQIIFNVVRQRPADRFLAEARRATWACWPACRWPPGC